MNLFDGSQDGIEGTRSKSSGLAFLLSLVLPGAGQLYCGKIKRGVWTVILFSVAATGTFFFIGAETGDTDLLLGIFLRSGIFLYVFAFLDAYCTAREINDGSDIRTVFNPRVAAILNLLTRGFGYFYLGEKKKGVLLFFLIGIGSQAIRNLDEPQVVMVIEILLELVLAALAADAYRIAVTAREDLASSDAAAPARPTEESGLKPAIPLALAGLLTAGYVGLTVVGYSMPDYSVLDQSQAVFTTSEDGKSYVNSAYGVQATIPEGWEFNDVDPSSFFEASYMAGMCSVSFLPDSTLPIYSPEAYAEMLVETILDANPNFKYIDTMTVSLAGRPATEVLLEADVDGSKVSQHYLVIIDGMTVYALVETALDFFRPTCEDAYTSIRESIQLP